MIGSWSLQPLASIPVIAREVFSLTSDIGVYTIGPGGDFDTSRPPSLSRRRDSAEQPGTPAAVTSLTRSGSVVTATMTSHGVTGSERDDSWG